jgi:hypothetical protein
MTNLKKNNNSGITKQKDIKLGPKYTKREIRRRNQRMTDNTMVRRYQRIQTFLRSTKEIK